MEALVWVVAGVLLGLVVLVTLTGFHVGPHAHLLAGGIGALAAAWLIAMAVGGLGAPLLWALLSADVVVSAGVGLLAWKGLASRRLDLPAHHLVSPEAAVGVAVDDLDPCGIVRVNGENWSAVALNGTVPAGIAVQVIRVHGLRLEVWGEETLPDSSRTGLDDGGSDHGPFTPLPGLPMSPEHPVSQHSTEIVSERRSP